MSSRKQSRKQNNALELKLYYLTEYVQRLRDDLGRPRCRTSEAASSLIQYCKNTPDPLLPFLKREHIQIEEIYPTQDDGCRCIVI
ncbi:putative guanine nucleotide-binding protein gamma subunit [Serendipita vermifera]|nr:putative guanine nucleotide-binding protein gamma subunit [Serendipita vermifera]